MEFKAQLYPTKTKWNAANKKAHETLTPKQIGTDEENNPIFENNGYTSTAYASNPIETIDGQFGLVELKGFESQLKDAGFNFVLLEKSIIKPIEND